VILTRVQHVQDYARQTVTYSTATVHISYVTNTALCHFNNFLGVQFIIPLLGTITKL